MKVYNYNEQGYLIGTSELDESDKCQITGDWIIPGMATEKEPLEAKEGYEVKFNGKDWQYIKLLTDEEKKIQGLIPLEEGEKIVVGTLIKVEKPSDLHSWNYDTKEWYLDEEKVRISKLPKPKEELKAQIQLGALNILTELGLI